MLRARTVWHWSNILQHKNRDICRDVPCLWALTRSRQGLGSILSPTHQHSACDRRRTCAGERDRDNGTVISRCRFARSVEHTSVLQSPMRHSYAVYCLIKKKHTIV